jgi:hypothetical protein
MAGNWRDRPKKAPWRKGGSAARNGCPGVRPPRQPQSSAALALREFTQDKCYLGRELDEASDDTLTQVRGYPSPDAGFTLNETDYLLRHQQPPGDPLTPAVETVAQVLTEMRDELQTMQDGLVIETDLNGEVTRKFLGLLKWDPAHVELVVATLNSEPAFTASLADLPVWGPSFLRQWRHAWHGMQRAAS